MEFCYPYYTIHKTEATWKHAFDTYTIDKIPIYSWAINDLNHHLFFFFHSSYLYFDFLSSNIIQNSCTGISIDIEYCIDPPPSHSFFVMLYSNVFLSSKNQINDITFRNFFMKLFAGSWFSSSLRFVWYNYYMRERKTKLWE